MREDRDTGRQRFRPIPFQRGLLIRTSDGRCGIISYVGLWEIRVVIDGCEESIKGMDVAYVQPPDPPEPVL